MSLQSCQWREFLVKTLSLFCLFFDSERWLQSLQFGVWEEEHDGHGDDERLGARVQAGAVPARGELPGARARAVPGAAAARGPAQLGALGSQVPLRFPALGSTPVPPNYCLGGRDGTYTQPSVPHTVIWHATIKLRGSQCHFISTAFPLMKYLQSSHTATSLVFAFKAIMWKFGLWFWYIHCSWICNEQNLYLNICYKLIIWKHRTPLFFVVVTNLTLPDFKQVP